MGRAWPVFAQLITGVCRDGFERRTRSEHLRLQAAWLNSGSQSYVTLISSPRRLAVPLVQSETFVWAEAPEGRGKEHAVTAAPRWVHLMPDFLQLPLNWSWQEQELAQIWWWWGWWWCNQLWLILSRTIVCIDFYFFYFFLLNIQL